MPIAADSNAAHAGLSFDRPMPAALVHKRSIHEVLITDAAEVDADTFALAAQLPRRHPMYGENRTPFYDVMLACELKRQAGVLIAHRFCAIPHGYQFVFRALRLDVRSLDAALIGDRPAEVLVTTRIAEREERDGALGAYTIESEFRIGGELLVDCTGAVSFVPPEGYRRLRERLREGGPRGGECGRSLVPIDAGLVGRRDPANVLLAELDRSGAPGAYRARLIVDPAHACLFDHPLDHVPGILMLEAANQLTIVALGDRDGVAPAALVPVASHARFTRFAELDGDAVACSVEDLRRDGSRVTATVRMDQAGTPVYQGSVAFEVLGARFAAPAAPEQTEPVVA